MLYTAVSKMNLIPSGIQISWIQTIITQSNLALQCSVFLHNNQKLCTWMYPALIHLSQCFLLTKLTDSFHSHLAINWHSPPL